MCSLYIDVKKQSDYSPYLIAIQLVFFFRMINSWNKQILVKIGFNLTILILFWVTFSKCLILFFLFRSNDTFYQYVWKSQRFLMSKTWRWNRSFLMLKNNFKIDDMIFFNESLSYFISNLFSLLLLCKS